MTRLFTFAARSRVSGKITIRIGGEDGRWHQVASWELERGKSWAHPLARRPGPLRWRAELWPLHVPPGLRVSKTVEGTASIRSEACGETISASAEVLVD